MTYFNNLSKVLYNFGDEVTSSVFQNITSYADLLDDIKDASSFHEKYTIQQGERPDQVSQKFYDTTEHYWTFYLINDHIRLQGWPLSSRKLEEKVKADFPNTVFTTRNNLTGIFKVGETVSGNSSGASGTIIKRNLDLGQVFVEGTVAFSSTETMTSSAGASVTTTGFTQEHNAIHHYENANKQHVDIDPFNTPSTLLTPITNFERYIAENDLLKQINVIKPSLVEQISSEFKKVLSN
tara:strand:+ start:76 stop:789 length:714 start_codon:yes stop_codon:yes gene_type:complete